MTEPMLLRLELRSAAAFGRGDGVPGLVDREVEHDSSGLPYMRGKTLKGLLAEEAENLVYLLRGRNDAPAWRKAKNHLFGVAGSSLGERGCMHVGDARLPASLRALIQAEVADRNWTPAEVLDSLTAIRRQTAMNARGGPERTTLRAVRVVIRGTLLDSVLTFDDGLTAHDEALLTASVLALRRAGTGRSRGRGWLKAILDDEAATRTRFELFQRLLKEGQ